jgi:anti-anti-sigma factor
MQISALTQNQTSIVTISGSVDAQTAGEVTQYLSGQISAGWRQIILDMSQIDFMSSAGLRAILIALKGSRQQGGDLYLAGAQAGVEKVLKMAGFTSFVKTFATIEEAAAEFNA